LTEERKAAEPDQGFSTFFSETGKKYLVLAYAAYDLRAIAQQVKANMSPERFTAISNPMSSMKFALAPTAACFILSK
jgi:hypothetical protein